VLSDGLFDITSGVLRRVWDFKAGRVPQPEQLHSVLPLIGWSQVEWNGQTIRLPRAGMEIDFGGFGKEYAADRAMAVLHATGQRHGYVNLGGDIRVLGPRADGSAWRFGIQHPRQPEATIASVELAEGALATSGDYERYFEQGGRRYCHILDPHTGQPVSHWAGVSVTAPACVAAGALSTIAMLKGRLELMEQAKRDDELKKMYGEKGAIAWGNQIRSYVLDDRRVKDHRTNVETLKGPIRNVNGAIYRFEPRTSRFDRYVPYGFANPHGRVFD
jgi:thiamine biosynthesis lipoprotein ApbE